MKRTAIALCAVTAFFLVSPAVHAQGIEPVWGYEAGPAVPLYDAYSGLEVGIYPLLGLDVYLSGAFALRASVYGGGAIAGASGDVSGDPLGGAYLTYGFGGNVEIINSGLLLGAGYGWTGATLEAAGNNLSTFVRGTLGVQAGGYGNKAFKAFAFKFHYDYNFDGGFRIGLLWSFYFPLLSKPAPRPVPPPQPAPPPPPPLPPPPPPPLGRIYYDYNGTGYAYLSDAVFYRSLDGKPLGYGEGGAIYAFGGRCLGFMEGNFIYDLKGLPKGAVDPINLGLDAGAKKPVTQAAKQSLPAKQSPVPVTKPKLRNGYFGGLLSDVFN